MVAYPSSKPPACRENSVSITDLPDISSCTAIVINNIQPDSGPWPSAGIINYANKTKRYNYDCSLCNPSPQQLNENHLAKNNLFPTCPLATPHGYKLLNTKRKGGPVRLARPFFSVWHHVTSFLACTPSMVPHILCLHTVPDCNPSSNRVLAPIPWTISDVHPCPSTNYIADFFEHIN